jgi:hypothetical protein
MSSTTSHPSLRWILIRTWRIRAARIIIKIAGGLMTIAENLTPDDLRKSWRR